MMKHKRVRERGKIQFSRYFQELKAGDKVAVVRELALPAHFPKQLQGRTGIIQGRRGKAYIVKMRAYHREKTYLIKSVHLRKI